MARKHYHVFTGIGWGYIPDCQGKFDTLTQAREALRFEKESFLEYIAQSPDDETVRVSGSIRSGYIRMYDPSPLSSFERIAYIGECTYDDCTYDDYELDDEY